jgi:hypothetical protein
MYERLTNEFINAISDIKEKGEAKRFFPEEQALN